MRAKCPNCGKPTPDGWFCKDSAGFSCAKDYATKHALMAVCHVAPTPERTVSVHNSQACPRCGQRDTIRETQEGGDCTRYICRPCDAYFSVYARPQLYEPGDEPCGEQMEIFTKRDAGMVA